MSTSSDSSRILQTTVGDFPLHEYRLRLAERTWSILHTHTMLTDADEGHFFRVLRNQLPYGVALWPAAIALAHDVTSRVEEFRGKRVLELGAGTGLPGIVAASLGAQVMQTDRHELAMLVCQQNAERNGVRNIEYRQADWTSWDDPQRYDWIIGSDILYAEALHPQLQQIFARNLAPNGRILLADPFRQPSLLILQALEDQGWAISLSKWSVGEEAAERSIGIYELAPPKPEG